MRTTIQLLTASALAAALSGCAFSDSAPASSGAPVDCRARLTRGDPRDGCSCVKLEPGAQPNSALPAVAHCDDTYAGVGTTICCKSDTSCSCDYVGCEAEVMFGSNCECGRGRGTDQMTDIAAVDSCPLPDSGRCCANDGKLRCLCDETNAVCSSEDGDRSVDGCAATTVPPGCGALEVQVASCDDS